MLHHHKLAGNEEVAGAGAGLEAAAAGARPAGVTRSLVLAATLLLAACGPKLEGEVIAGRTVMVTNREDGDVVVTRIVANDEDGRAECTDAPGTRLPPGRSYTTTFFLCDEVREVDVETDRGSREIAF